MTESKEAKPQNVYQAIAKVQAALAKEGISKDRISGAEGGNSPKFKFRGIDDVYNTISGLLAENGLCILPRLITRETSERKKPDGKMLYFVAVEVEYDLVSSHDGSKHTIKVPGEAMDSGDKATNKAMSAAYKYACLQTFCIPTEGDNDADATTHEVIAKVSNVFDTAEALEQYVTNCVDTINKADSIQRIKDLKDLEAAKRQALKTSDCIADIEAFNRIAKAQADMLAKLRPITVEDAKKNPADALGGDTIPY